jgi:hypothetical protein
MICTKKNGQNITLGRGATECSGASDAMTVYIAVP